MQRDNMATAINLYLNFGLTEINVYYWRYDSYTLHTEV
jgi:hypothetical protein